MSTENPTQIHATGEATGFIPAPGRFERGLQSASTCEVEEHWKSRDVLSVESRSGVNAARQRGDQVSLYV